ncbi:hypothetical protein F4808DRAFT_172930 [Astrocystis sublimbata]|nr:hypothetical protein F4808DRAFT_172930 [Astrocystis sublimbata]
MTCMVLNTFTARLHRLVGSRSKGAAANEKRYSHTLQISAPFDFKHETISLPGLSEDDIATMKKKAAAARLGVSYDEGDADDIPSPFGSPRKAPRAPHAPARPVRVTPVTALSPEDNVI